MFSYMYTLQLEMLKLLIPQLSAAKSQLSISLNLVTEVQLSELYLPALLSPFCLVAALHFVLSGIVLSGLFHGSRELCRLLPSAFELCNFQL